MSGVKGHIQYPESVTLGWCLGCEEITKLDHLGANKKYRCSSCKILSVLPDLVPIREYNLLKEVNKCGGGKLEKVDTMRCSKGIHRGLAENTCPECTHDTLVSELEAEREKVKIAVEYFNTLKRTHQNCGCDSICDKAIEAVESEGKDADRN